jgi:hypothetical protein
MMARLAAAHDQQRAGYLVDNAITFVSLPSLVVAVQPLGSERQANHRRYITRTPGFRNSPRTHMVRVLIRRVPHKR